MGDASSQQDAMIRESRSRSVRRLRDLCASMESVMEALNLVYEELVDVATAFIFADELNGAEAGEDDGCQSG